MDQNPNQPGRLPQPQTPSNTNQNPVGPEVEPPSSPVPPSAFDTLSRPTEFQPIQLQPTKPKSRRKLWIILASVLVVLLGGSAAAYQFWYQNPEKVIADGVMHALQAKTTTYTGAVTYATTGGGFKLAVDGVYDTGAQNLNADVTISYNDQDYRIKGSALVDRNSDLYVRLNDLPSLLEPFLADMPDDVRVGADRIVAKINNQWIKLNAAELAVYNQSLARSQTCWSNAVQQTENHASFLDEIATSYQKNRYITVSEQLGPKEGSFGYVLAVDKEKLRAFIHELKNTQTYRTLHECDASFEINESAFESAPEGVAARTEIWVSTFSHEITKVTNEITYDNDKTTTELRPVFNQPVSVKAPEKSITLKQLQADIEAITQEMQEAQQQAAQQGAGSGQSANDDPLGSAI